jgi:hypothetical protein
MAIPERIGELVSFDHHHFMRLGHQDPIDKGGEQSVDSLRLVAGGGAAGEAISEREEKHQIRRRISEYGCGLLASLEGR